MTHDYSRTIRLVDTDAAGVVYFAHVLSMCHEAYEAALEATGINLREFFRDAAAAIPIVRGEVDFFRPLFCGDEILIRLSPQQLSENEFEIAYQILSATDLNQCLASAKTRHVCINPATRRRISLPESMLQWLSEN
jgi:1,4-dihydroxy-2-naphthoyl-CoA hydrolase